MSRVRSRDLELQLEGLVLVRALLETRGASEDELENHSSEIERVRARLAAKGGDAHSVAA